MERLFAELARSLDHLQLLPDGIAGVLHGRAVQVIRVQGAAVEWVILRAAICGAADMDPNLVLERNARLAFAALALSNGEYWLRISLPADSAELADPKRAIALLVDAADSLLPRQSAANPAAFSHWAA